MLVDNLPAARDPPALIASGELPIVSMPSFVWRDCGLWVLCGLGRDDGSTMLAPGLFTQLLNIRPGYHLFRREMECWIEPYTPSLFARQFGYDQLYVGNPNSVLVARGTLLEGARAWFYSIVGGTEVTFSLPSLHPKLLCSLNFGCWFLAATGVGVPPSFLTNLGGGGTGEDARTGTPEAGAEARMIEGPTGSNPSSRRRGRK